MKPGTKPGKKPRGKLGAQPGVEAGVEAGDDPRDGAPERVDAPERPAAPRRAWRPSRRGFLVALGASGIGIALGVRYGVPEARLQIARAIDGGALPGRIDAEPTAWLELHPHDGVTLFVPKVEMGQGIHTALALVAAEELELEPARLRVRQSGTASGPQDRLGTSASASVSSLFTPLREAAAAFREMIRVAAAPLLGAPVANLRAYDGFVYDSRDPSVRVSYEEVARATSDWPKPPAAPPLKARADFRFIGRSSPRVDLYDKLTGRAVYGYDARLPGMLYGAAAHPRTFEGRLEQAAPGRARNVPGVVTVVATNEFAGVAATSRAAARAGVEALELRWDDGRAWSQSEIDGLVTVRSGEGVTIQREGSAGRELGATPFTAEYRTPLAAHASLEPPAALVDANGERARVWVSSQSAHAVRRDVARALGRREDDVEVTPTYLGGGFGRKIAVEAAVEAALLSRASGRPVHVGWTREEEFALGYVRPPTHHVLRAALDGGRVRALEHQQASGDVAFGSLPAAAATVLGADFGAWRGATILYGGIPHRRAVAQRVRLPMRTGWWRGLGLLANTFAIESFIDELAHEAGVDPLAFRLAHLGADEFGHRMRGVLVRAAEASDWGAEPRAGRALGIACSVDVNTVVAQVAEVSVQDGRPRVHRVVCAMDPGLVVHPDGARAQVEGSVMWGVSSALLERLEVHGGRFDAANFDAYPFLGMNDAPDVEVHLLESGVEPFGVGEPPLGPVAAAVANATFALTGQRLRSLPLAL